MNKKIVLLFTALLITPITTLAVDFGTPPAVQTTVPASFIADKLGAVLDLIWIVFIAFAIIMFILAAFQFLSAQGEPDGIGKARKMVIYGIIGVAIAIAAFAIPFFIKNKVSPPAAVDQCGGNCGAGQTCVNGTCI